MRFLPRLLLTALLGAAVAAPTWAGAGTYRTGFDREGEGTLLASSRHSGKGFHGHGHHFGQRQRFAPHHRPHHFFDRHDRRFHDDFFSRRHDHRFRSPFLHRPHHGFPKGHLSPHDRVTVCVRSDGVLFCYRTFR